MVKIYSLSFEIVLFKILNWVDVSNREIDFQEKKIIYGNIYS